MKQILRNISILSISVLVSIGTAKAQTTIFEQDGANNELTPSDWIITNDMGFSSPSEIVIGKQESGTLALNDHQIYKDVTCEIHLNANPGSQFPITFNGYNGAKLTHIFTYKQHNGDGINRLLFTFDSNTFNSIDLKEMVFKNNANMIIKINYIKITGVKTSGLFTEELNAFDVKVSPENIIVDSKMDGTLNIYNALGQVQGTYSIIKGENTLSNATQGLLFLALANSENKMVSRKKIMR